MVFHDISTLVSIIGSYLRLVYEFHALLYSHQLIDHNPFHEMNSF